MLGKEISEEPKDTIVRKTKMRVGKEGHKNKED